MKSNSILLTSESLALLLALVRDSGNWSGNPLVDLTKEQRGNLSDLKKKNLLSTQSEEGCEWAFFKFSEIEVTDGSKSYKLVKGEYGSSATEIVT